MEWFNISLLIFILCAVILIARSIAVYKNSDPKDYIGKSLSKIEIWMIWLCILVAIPKIFIFITW